MGMQRIYSNPDPHGGNFDKSLMAFTNLNKLRYLLKNM
jgi:hypothetical protein